MTIRGLLIAMLLTSFAAAQNGRLNGWGGRRTPKPPRWTQGFANGNDQNVETSADEPWSDDEVISPEALAKLMTSQQKPLVLQVGVPFLFRTAHIAGSRQVGQAALSSGIEQLKKAARELPRDSEVVIYCGCCPWKACPNIRPAFKTLKGMGFKRLKVLYLPNNLNQDWINKSFPTEKGESTKGTR